MCIDVRIPDFDQLRSGKVKIQAQSNLVLKASIDGGITTSAGMPLDGFINVTDQCLLVGAWILGLCSING